MTATGPDNSAVLSVAECRELLGTTTVGRVAMVTPQGPRIVPINFTVHDNSVLFRTAPYSELASYARDQQIAFEVDHLDHEHHRGWSVSAVGRCQQLTDPEILHWVNSEWLPQPWAGGQKALLLQLPWTELTGRRVGGDHWPHPPTPLGH